MINIIAAIIGISALCMVFADFKDDDFGLEGASPAYLCYPDSGAIITPVYMMLSLGGQGADWMLAGFNKRGAAAMIAIDSAGQFELLSSGIAVITVDGRVIGSGCKTKVTEDSMMEIRLSEEDEYSWKFLFKRV